MKAGAHLRNESNLHPNDKTLYNMGGFECVVAFSYQDPGEVLALVGGDPSRVIVRLEDSVRDGRVLNFDELHLAWKATIERWAPHGVTLFVLDNEPNLSWVAIGYIPAPGQTVEQAWSWLIRRALKDLTLPPGVILLLTPFSHPSLHTNWMDEALREESGYPSVVSYCRGAAAHTYWQAESDAYANWAGGEYAYVHERTGLDIYITESGCSSEHDTEGKRVRGYPAYIKSTSTVPYVKMLAFFILGSNGDWAFFEMSEAVLKSIGQRPY